METKDKLLKNSSLRPSASDGRMEGGKNNSLVKEAENDSSDLLKQRINNFLINYFNYLILALALIIFIAGLFLFIYPQYQEIANGNKTANKNLQSEYETQAGYLSAISDLKDSYELISSEDRKKIGSMVPESSQVNSLIPEIESIILKNGAVLNSIKTETAFKNQTNKTTEVASGEKTAPSAGIFEQLPPGVGLARTDISLSSVNYPVLKNLLKTFENNLRLFDISKVSYDVQKSEAVFTIYSYYLTR